MELEATIVGKYSAVAPVLDERSRRRWAAAESAAIGYGGDALVSSATGLARETIRNGRREIARGEPPTSRIRVPGAGRPGIEQDQPGVLAALEALVDPLTRGDPTSPLRWTCKSRAKLAAALCCHQCRIEATATLPTRHEQVEQGRRGGEDDSVRRLRHDALVEGLCAAFYAARMGRPSLRPGRYFRLLVIGYFEGLSSERGETTCRSARRRTGHRDAWVTASIGSRG